MMNSEEDLKQRKMFNAFVKDMNLSNENVVKQPEHYKHGEFECIDEMIIVFGPKQTYSFCILNAWKYRARAPCKNNLAEDMKKADRYLQIAFVILKNYPKYFDSNDAKLVSNYLDK